MNPRQFLSLLLVAALFLSPAISLAQQNNFPEPKPKVSDAESKEKAYALLESLAAQISTLQSPENRARIGSNIAASVWTHDEKRARALFIAVGEDINSGLQRYETEDRSEETNTLMVFLHLRENTIDRIAKYDPEFAFDFLKATEVSFKDPPEDVVEKERSLTLRLAKQVAAANPDLALRLGRKSLDQGFSGDLLSLLRQLHRKHREQGVTLYKETVRKLQNTKFNQNWMLMNFARRLAELTPPLTDEMAFRELMNTLMTIALASKCDKENSDWDINYFCQQLGGIVSQMEKIDPVRAAKLKHLESESSWGPNVESELDELIQARDYDEILALAERNPASKHSIYWRAFQLAKSTGDLERARKIANALSSNPEMQQELLIKVESAEQSKKLSEGELEGILKEAEKEGRLKDRLSNLLVAAVHMGSKDRSAALKLFDRANELSEGLKVDNERTQVKAFLAMLYCMEKSDRGFAIMEELMPKLNELIEAAAKLDGFDMKYLRDGEWNMSSNGTLGRLLTELSENAGYFAWCDFDRAVNMASQLQRTEIRMMAQLKLAQAILGGPPKRYSLEGYE